jgi:hypothetical protein
MHDWREVLLNLSTVLTKHLLVEWRMINGAAFQMLLPQVADFLDEGFCKDLEWPFCFRDIVSIKVLTTVPLFPLIAEDIDTIIEVLASRTEFEVLRFEDGIEVKRRRS